MVKRLPLSDADFRRVALGLEGAVEGSHMNHPDFRANGRIFATLVANTKADKGVVMLTPDEQAVLVSAAPDVFAPVPGGWGRNGSTHVHLAKASEADLKSALTTAWKGVMTKKAGKPRKRS